MACGLRWGDDNLIVLSEIPIATRFCDKHVVRIGLLTECHDQVAFVYHSVKLLLFLWCRIESKKFIAVFFFWQNGIQKPLDQDAILIS